MGEVREKVIFTNIFDEYLEKAAAPEVENYDLCYSKLLTQSVAHFPRNPHFGQFKERIKTGKKPCTVKYI